MGLFFSLGMQRSSIVFNDSLVKRVIIWYLTNLTNKLGPCRAKLAQTPVAKSADIPPGMLCVPRARLALLLENTAYYFSQIISILNNE